MTRNRAAVPRVLGGSARRAGVFAVISYRLGPCLDLGCRGKACVVSNRYVRGDFGSGLCVGA